MRVLALIFSLFLLALRANPAEATPKRVVSTSLCADTYVLDAVDTTRIQALSWQAGDALSTAPENLRIKPKAWDDIERLLALKPDLVVFGPGEGRAAQPLLDKMGIAHISLNWVEDFKGISKNQTLLAQALGQIPPPSPNLAETSTPKTKVLYLSSSGATAGAGTFVDAAIGRAGGENIITKPGWFTPDMESLFGLSPDLIVTSFIKDGYASINENTKRHFVIRDMINKTPHINVPGKLWPCAGPRLFDASQIIAKALADID